MHYRNKNVSKFDKDQTSWRKWATKETPLLLNMSWFKYDLLNLKIRNPANTHFSKNTHSRSSLRFSEPWRIFNTWWRWCLAAAVWLFSLFHPKSHKTDFSVCSKSTNEYKLALIARWQAFAVERETSHLFCIEGCIFYTLHGSQKCCAGLFCHACPFFLSIKPKAMVVITAQNARELRCCWAVISPNMLLFIHMLLFEDPFLCIHASSCSVSVSLCCDWSAGTCSL